MTIRAIVENDTIRLPVHVPNGTSVEVIVTVDGEKLEDTPGALARRYAQYVGMADDLPEDFAENHDHYLHGAPKRV